MATAAIGTRNHLRCSASRYWIAKYVQASAANASPSTSSEPDACALSAPNAAVIRMWEANA